jgi:hypothetical protein
MSRFVLQLASAQSSLMFMMNPDAGISPDVTFVPDLRPGTPANTYTFDGTYDGNGDGLSETTISGKLTYAGDPASLAWSPLSGQATMNVDLPVVGHIYDATLAFTATATEVRLSGSGTFSNPVTGETTTIDIPAGNPVIVKSVSGISGVVANACGYSLDGSIPIQLSDSTGTLNSTWLFSPNTASVAVQRATFRDSAGQSTTMPDSSVTLSCHASNSIDDWAAVYDQVWVCLPLEYGRAQLTLSVSGANTISITDEDPPGSGDTNVYTATIVGASPSVVQGFFDAGPVGDRYREYFTWTLKENGGFSQVSHYAYTEGPNKDSGGACAATAKRRP